MTASPLTPYLGQTVNVRIDRPLGSRHPRFPQTIYPINYGFVPDTMAGDGAEIDAYVLGVDRPLQTFTGTCIAVVQRGDDAEDKLVLAPSGQHVTHAQITAALAFQEQYFDSRVIMADAAPNALSPPSANR